MQQQGAPYRPDIDGLRAVAVLGVMLFHAGLDAVPGGFLGVDVFFVISGYLITGLIVPRLRAGTFSLLGFYDRRIRRLFPALLLVIVVTLLAGGFVLLPGAFARLGESAAAASLFLSNVHFHDQGGYFAPAAETQPLLHSWSLAVEEQFYIVYPLLLAFLQRRWPGRLRLAIALLAALSFAAALATLAYSARSAFFLPHTRAWELLLGATVALTPAPVWLAGRWREAAMGLGLLLIASALLCLGEDSGIPGFAALWPTAGTALVLLAGAAGPSLVGRGLAWRPLVGLGLISYSLYLWHWPLLVLLRENQVGAATPLQVGLALLLALALAILTWAFVEQPFRRLVPRPRRAVAAGAAASLAVLAVGLAVSLGDGWPWRFDAARLRYAVLLEAETHYAAYDRGGCFLDSDQQAEDYDPVACLPGAETPRERRLLIWGDSFAAHYFPGLRQSLGARGWAVSQYTATSCRPLRSGTDRRCDEVLAALPAILAWQGGFGTLLVAGHYQPLVLRLGEAELLARLGESLALAKATGARVLLVGQTPTFAFAIPRLLVIDRAARARPEIRLPAERYQDLNAKLRALAAAAGVDFFDPAAAACNEQGCLAALEGEPLLWDSGHFTAAGSAFYGAGIAERLAGP